MLVSHVHRRCRIITDDNYRKAGCYAKPIFEFLNLKSNLLAKLSRYNFAVYNFCHSLFFVFRICRNFNGANCPFENLEFAFVNDKRADVVADLLSSGVCPPSRRILGKRTLLYYKSNVKISDVLYYCGALNASFEVTNLAIARDIRNETNRTTNFETSNMQRTVEAKKRYIDAIRYLTEHDKLSLLGDELGYTANLRIEYDDASLSALAKLHIPPISKSGLNARLSKILAIADEVKAQTEK